MNKSGIPYLDLAWNPCGFGCSNGCEACWARAITARMGKSLCPDCRAFNVHIHPERLEGKLAPFARKKPAVVGVQFTGDLFDAERSALQIERVLDTALAAPQHTYVFLTQQISRAQQWFSQSAWWHEYGLTSLPDNWFIGATVRTQEQWNATAPLLMTIPGRKWLSIEPLEGPLDLRLCPQDETCEADEPFPVACSPCSSGRHWLWMHEGEWCGLEGVVVGHNNSFLHAGTGTLSHVRGVVEQCRAADKKVPVYVKQLWLTKCTCGQFNHGPHGCPVNGMDGRRLYRDVAEFPEDLQVRQLPWTTATKGDGNGDGKLNAENVETAEKETV